MLCWSSTCPPRLSIVCRPRDREKASANRAAKISGELDDHDVLDDEWWSWTWWRIREQSRPWSPQSTINEWPTNLCCKIWTSGQHCRLKTMLEVFSPAPVAHRASRWAAPWRLDRLSLPPHFKNSEQPDKGEYYIWNCSRRTQFSCKTQQTVSLCIWKWEMRVSLVLLQGNCDQLFVQHETISSPFPLEKVSIIMFRILLSDHQHKCAHVMISATTTGFLLQWLPSFWCPHLHDLWESAKNKNSTQEPF